MSDRIDILAVIPARAGSKRLPGKNVMPLNGKPLVRWTMEAALQSRVIDAVVVSSDDDRVLDEASALGIRGIERPAVLASDTATTFDVLVHVLDTLAAEQVFPKRLMLLQPTSPLRDSSEIVRAVAVMDESGADSVVSVCPCEHSPLWSNTLGPQGKMDDFLREELRSVRSQDLPTYYRLNGALYLADTERFIKSRGFFMSNSRAHVMPVEKSIDIDTRIDFKLCELLLEKNR